MCVCNVTGGIFAEGPKECRAGVRERRQAQRSLGTYEISTGLFNVC